MNASGNGLKVVHSSSLPGADRSPASRLQIIAAAVGLAVLLVGGARTLPQLDEDRANDAAAQPRAEVRVEPTTIDYFPDGPEHDAGRVNDPVAQSKAATQAGPAAFVYFPAQYENQATEVEEHIQAF